MTISREQIKQVFLAHGFTIKPGQDDLKEYVYAAAEALIAQAQAAPVAEPVADPVAWVPSAVLAKLRNGSNNAPCVLTDGPAEFNDTAVYLAPQHDAELIELLERCIHRWDKLSSAFIYTTPSYKEEQAHIDELRAKLATLRHV